MFRSAAALAALLLLTQCSPIGLAVGAGATVGVAASEERGARQAAIDTGTQIGIKERLFQKDLDLFGQVGVAVVENRVLLTGVVPSTEAREEAARLAWAGQNVDEVINELQLQGQGATTDFGTDTRITTAMRSRLVGDKEVFDLNYTLETVNGTLYLLGIAQNQRELDRVLSYARDISGVRRVIPHVLLKDDPRRKKPA